MAGVLCVLCNHFMPLTPLSGNGASICPSCRRPVSIGIFPALLEGAEAKPPTLPADPPAEGEAACFYSPNRRATKECSHCGVLISDMWAAQWGSDTVCLKCLEHLRQQGKDERFQGSRVLWDNIALFLALLPFSVVFWWAVFLSAPASLFIGLRHWNSPRSLVPRGRARLAIAIVLALLQVGGLAFGAAALWFGWFRSK